MYDNIGGKIKGLAKIMFIVETVAAVIAGIIIMASYRETIPLGLLVMLAGPAVALITSWLLYGMGQLIENSDIIAEEYNRKNEANLREKVKAIIADKDIAVDEKVKAIIADKDIAVDEFVDITCPNCKEKLTFTKEYIKKGDVLCPMCDTYLPLD